MGRPKKPPGEALDEMIAVRFTQDEKQLLDAAVGDGDRSQWIRDKLLAKAKEPTGSVIWAYSGLRVEVTLPLSRDDWKRLVRYVQEVLEPVPEAS
jgi:hypothetical protein